MKWRDRRISGNVEDRRRIGGKQVAVGGGIGGIILVILFALLGGNPEDATRILEQGGMETGAGETRPLTEEEIQEGRFVGVVLAETEDVWNRLFQEAGRSYREPKLVLFSERISSACGFAGAASGPFYCPGDERVYIDLDFFKQMQDRLEAGGDFALAYVIAHEIGHHVQNLLGITDKVMAQRNRLEAEEFNRLMVRLELQADFLAGVWAYYADRTAGLLEEGDIEEAMNAAAAVGDDRIMRQTQGYVVPDAFTHGTSEQRVRWFSKGFQTGDITQGDTFKAGGL